MDRAKPKKPRGPNGGKRAGAGRPPGAKNTLGYGQVAALKACRLRIPDDASPEADELAGRALQRIIDVMEEKVSPLVAGHVLKASTHLREEVCGSTTQKVAQVDASGKALSFTIVRKDKAP